MRATTLALGTALLVLAAPALAQAPGVNLPPGFTISVFASGLGIPRFLTLDPSGTLLVSIPSQGRVVALPDTDGHGKTDAITVVTGLDRPHGLAWKNGDLYVAETGRVLRFRYDPATRKATSAVVVVPNLPQGGKQRGRLRRGAVRHGNAERGGVRVFPNGGTLGRRQRARLAW
jgi:glucose/arabinose dehydrogenase